MFVHLAIVTLLCTFQIGLLSLLGQSNGDVSSILQGVESKQGQIMRTVIWSRWGASPEDEPRMSQPIVELRLVVLLLGALVVPVQYSLSIGPA
jgi:hypothetical protein